MRYKLEYSLLVFVLVVGLSACGSGSGGSQDASPDIHKTPVPIKNEEDGWYFQKVTESSGLSHSWGVKEFDDESMPHFFSGGVAAGDFDRDGLVDIFIDSGDLEPSKLYKNIGSNQFIDVADIAGVQLYDHIGSGPSFADVNGDGWVDLFIGGIEGSGNRLFVNNKDGTFSDFTVESGLIMSAENTVSSAFGDYDRDGDLDLVVTHWGNVAIEDTEHLWRNDGSGRFESVSIETGIADQIIVKDNDLGLLDGDRDYTFTPNFVDINSDGWLDLTFAGDFRTSKYFINDRAGGFIDLTDSEIRDQNGMGAAVGDYDNDGDLDWFVTGIFERYDVTGQISLIGNRFYRNNANESFTDWTFTTRTADTGWSWGACFSDFDNNGVLDLVVTNGWDSRSIHDEDADYFTDSTTYFSGSGAGYFIDQTELRRLSDRGQGRALVCFDADNDGDIDLLVVGNDVGVNAFTFYENISDSEGGNYLHIDLVSTGSNSYQIGARIYVTSGSVKQMREIRIGSNFMSQNPTTAYFGLADYDIVDEVRVVWSDSQETVLLNVDANQRITLRE